MVLEACVICIDNSEWMRNGDFSPSRYDAQFDACNLICGRKASDNAQNSIGLITSGGDRTEVRVTLTDDVGEIITALHKVKIGGRLKFVQSLKIAQLALLHKRNPNQMLRIIFFVGSPITDSEQEISHIAEVLKIHKISVDLVAFGETEVNNQKLEIFMNKLGDSSRLVLVPSGLGISLSDFLRSTPILVGGDSNVGGDTNVGGEDNYNDSLRNTDPELYEILEMSRRAYEEERSKTGTENPDTNPSNTEPSDLPPLDNDGDVQMFEDDMDEAIRLSLQTASGDDMNIDNDNTEVQNNPSSINSSEVQNNPPPNSSNLAIGELDTSNLGSEFFTDILKDLEGVDMNDPSVQNLISNLSNNNDKDKKDTKKDS